MSDLTSYDQIGGASRTWTWVFIIGALAYALLFLYCEWGGVAAYALAVLPIALAYLVTRTWLAAAAMLLLPMYFVLGRATSGWRHYQPFIALDHAMPLSPEWVLIYGSLYVCGFLLPILVVRGRELSGQAIKAYIFVMLVSYALFLVYPTIAPRDEQLPTTSFTTWTLRQFYDLDQPYGCFPSLHVAYSFVAAFACARVHRGVGVVAVTWAALIAISTVYTKQHFVVDAIAGAILGIVAYLLFLRGRAPMGMVISDRHEASRHAVFAAATYCAMIGCFWIVWTLR